MSLTAIFGGSFDPVHNGHVNVVKSLLEQRPDIDRVIIMPARVNPFKTENSPRADGMQRLEMCRLAFGAIPKCTVSDFEITQAGASYTILTLEHLKKLYPHDGFILTVGSDSLQSLPKWYRAADIFAMAEIAAVSRSQEDCGRISGFGEKISALGGRVCIINAKPFEISSTEIRKKILNNEDISCYTDENVVKYIYCNKIYL